MKRTCEGCRAFAAWSALFSCDLHYKMDPKNGKPLEECPKPKTYAQLMSEHEKDTKYARFRNSTLKQTVL